MIRNAETSNESSPPESFPFLEQLGRPLRVGGIDYLNSRPLVEGFSEVAPAGSVAVENLPPSELARRLREGTLDVALVPAVEYFLAPPDLPYRIVPGPGISSHGAVESIRLYHRVPLGEVRELAVDSSSQTSVLLTRLLFELRPDRRWRSGRLGRRPVVTTITPEEGTATVLAEAPSSSLPDAVLLIGDAALAIDRPAGWSVLDLGLEWTRWTGLPFVYAFWVFRGEPVDGVTECLQAVATRGIADIDRIVELGPLPVNMSCQDARRYLTHSIRYRLGDHELEGLREFVAKANECELIDIHSGRELRFLEATGSGVQS